MCWTQEVRKRRTGLDAKLECRVLVADHQSPGVVLQRARGPLKHAAFSSVHALQYERKSGLRSERLHPQCKPLAAAFYEKISRVPRLADDQAYRVGLFRPRNDQDDLTSIHNSGDTDSEGHAGDSGQVVVEEPGVRKDRIIRERLDARARNKGGSGLRR